VPELDDINIRLANLPARALRLKHGNRILIDVDAVGHSRLINQTPLYYSEFNRSRWYRSADSRQARVWLHPWIQASIVRGN
jgi:hypothetical protein